MTWTRRQVIGNGIGGLVAVGLVGTAAYGSIRAASAGTDLRSKLTIYAPAAPGGGWDTVARQMQQAERANGIVRNPQVVNTPGAGGTIALGNLALLEGDPQALMVGGTGQLAAIIEFESPVTYANVTPLAITVEEYDAILVPGNSPYQSLEQLVSDWQTRTREVPWTGGGSFDKLVVTDMAVKSGIDPAQMVYVGVSGGGETTTALLNGTAAAAAGGYPDSLDQIESGRLRALALVAKNPVEGTGIQTTVEQGVDVTLANWRLLVAPGGITEEEKGQLLEIIDETIATPQWLEAVDRFHWNPNPIRGPELATFLTEQEQSIRDLYARLGE